MIRRLFAWCDLAAALVALRIRYLDTREQLAAALNGFDELLAHHREVSRDLEAERERVATLGREKAAALADLDSARRELERAEAKLKHTEWQLERATDSTWGSGS